MVKLFSINDKSFLKNIQNSEAQLNRFLSENWVHFFPQYTFIKSEFPLNGIVRTSGSGGRIDILAFNPSSNKLVVFELKRDFSRNIRDQAGDYRDKIVSHFHEIYLRCTQDYDIQLPKYKTLNQDTIETVLVSNYFTPADIEKVNNFKNDNITLIKYSWFERNLLFIEYLNNAPIDSISSSSNHRQNEGIKRSEIIKQSQNIETFSPINAREQGYSTLTLKKGILLQRVMRLVITKNSLY